MAGNDRREDREGVGRAEKRAVSEGEIRLATTSSGAVVDGEERNITGSGENRKGSERKGGGCLMRERVSETEE
jgi:hypothetical protein